MFLLLSTQPGMYKPVFILSFYSLPIRSIFPEGQPRYRILHLEFPNESTSVSLMSRNQYNSEYRSFTSLSILCNVYRFSRSNSK